MSEQDKEKPVVAFTICKDGHIAVISYRAPQITYCLRDNSRREVDAAIEKLKVNLISKIINADVIYDSFFEIEESHD